MLGKTQTGVFSISGFLVNPLSLIKENCYSSRTSDDIDMKPGPAAILDKRKDTKRYISDTTYVRVLTCQISSFRHDFNEFLQGVILSPHLKTDP